MKGKRETHKNRIRRSKWDWAFDLTNGAIMIFLVIVTAYPMYYIICASFSETAQLRAFQGLLLAPIHFTTGAYKMAFVHPLTLSGFRNILIILAVSLPINIILTLICGYFMASKNVMFKKIFIIYFMITMFISGGLVPGYLNIRDLGLYDSLWALILPGAVSVYNAIIAKTAIEGIPDSLIESAYMDGAGELTILFRIIMPLIKPTVAVLLLYYGVGHWNSWFNASIYIDNQDLLPIQNVLRAILIENSDILGSGATGDVDVTVNQYTETIKYATIVVSTLPILVVYPFLQKYFTKGVMIGAVKG